MAFLEIKDLHFSYPGQSPALVIPELKIEKGERIFLYGPSGSGKTTLLEILSGVLVPQKGQVRVGDTALNELSASARDRFRAQKLAYIFQSFNLIPYLSARQNILLPLQLGKRSVENAQSQLQHLADVLGIQKVLDSGVTEISIGQQQRVAVARALILSPEIILADEPTSALDYDAREKFLGVLFDLCKEKNTTLIFVSHDRSLKDLFSRPINLSEINRRTV